MPVIPNGSGEWGVGPEDLRLNDDQMYGPDGNAEFETGNLNTSDFSLWGPYS